MNLSFRKQAIDLSQYTFCSWCKKVYDLEGVTEQPEIPYDIGDSHGICKKCYKQNMEEFKERKRKQDENRLR